MKATQNYDNHVRYFPLFHFVLFPLLVVNLLYQSFRLYQEPSWDRIVFTALSVAFILAILVSRLQAIRVQDRVIRLEERIRYRELLDAETAAKAADLDMQSIIALRFADDEELADLLHKRYAGQLADAKSIKRAVKKWRADHLRV